MKKFVCLFTLQAHCEFHLLLFSLKVWSRNLTLFHHLLELHIIPACLFCCQRLTSLRTRTLVSSNPWFGFVLICSFAFGLAFAYVLTLSFHMHPFEAWKQFFMKMYYFVQCNNTILSAIPLSMFAYCLSERSRICIKSVSHFLNWLMVFFCFFEFVCMRLFYFLFSFIFCVCTYILFTTSPRELWRWYVAQLGARMKINLADLFRAAFASLQGLAVWECWKMVFGIKFTRNILHNAVFRCPRKFLGFQVE